MYCSKAADAAGGGLQAAGGAQGNGLQPAAGHPLPFAGVQCPTVAARHREGVLPGLCYPLSNPEAPAQNIYIVCPSIFSTMMVYLTSCAFQNTTSYAQKYIFSLSLSLAADIQHFSTKQQCADLVEGLPSNTQAFPVLAIHMPLKFEAKSPRASWLMSIPHPYVNTAPFDS